MRKSIFSCAKCTPVKAFHLFIGTKLGNCEICMRKKSVAVIPKRYFKIKK